ncbi:MAG: MFS transporter [Agromyces sp.]
MMRTPSVRTVRSGAPTMTRAWLSLLAVALGVLVVQLDGTVVSIANPAIAADLSANLSQISWVTTAYLLVLAGLLIPAGNVADRIGHKKAFLIGIAGFSLASLLCGLAGSIEVLIGARVLQGLFAALLAPAGVAVIRTVFPPEKLAMGFGVFGSVSALALAGGPILGGLMVEHASWHWAFFINVPFGAVAIAIALAVIPSTTRTTAAALDLPGAVSLTLAMVCIIWSINGVQEHGWFGTQTLVFFAIGLALLAVFIVIERRRRDPMLPLGLFRNRSFTAGSVLMAVTMFAFFAILFYLTFFLQSVQGKPAIDAAVAILPMTIVFVVAAPLAGWVSSRLGVRTALVIGAVLTTTALVLFAGIQTDSTTVTMLPALLLAGLGAGFMMVPAIEAIVGSAPEDKAGVASGVQQSMQQLGSTLGIAVFGAILGQIVASQFKPNLLAAIGDADPSLSVVADSPEVQQAVALGFPSSAQDALSAQVPPELGSDLVSAITSAAHETFIGGLHTVFLVAAGVTVIAGLLALLIRTSDQQDATPTPTIDEVTSTATEAR